MYKLIKNYYDANSTAVLRFSDNASIPFDPDNTDYQEYLKWLAEGNTPLPSEDGTPEPADE